jgi:hypothetical protein
MEKYLKSVFGDDVRIEAINLTLPIYLKEQYNIYHLYILDKQMVIMQLKGEWPIITNVKKHIAAIERLCGMQAVLSLEYITPTMRKKLIQETIQFIVPNKQIFMPYCGIDLSEKYSKPARKTEHFSAKTQMLFTALCYDKNMAIGSYSDIAKRLKTNKMTISRAVSELENFEIIKTLQNGNAKRICLDKCGKELFEAGKGYLINPVAKRVLVKSADANYFCIAGMTALSSLTMIADNSTTYAVEKNKEKDFITYPDEYRGDSDISTVELWKYDPELFAKNHIVDFISLYASLKNTKDERVQIALEELEDKYEW